MNHGIDTSAAGGASCRTICDVARSPIERIRTLCLAQPDTWEKLSPGEPTFWVGKRMSASFADAANHHGAGRHWCNCDHTSQAMLVDEGGAQVSRRP